MGWMRKGTAVAVATLGLVVTLGGTAGAADAKVTPVLECVFPLEAGGYVALFGYSNENTTTVEVPIGDTNRFDPKPIERGQPTKFAPGRTIGAFTVNFDGKNLVWWLTGNRAIATDDSTQCDKPPVPVGTGSPQSFLWIGLVAGVLVVGAGGGTAWSFRRRRRHA
jgi:hypothetical protein